MIKVKFVDIGFGKIRDEHDINNAINEISAFGEFKDIKFIKYHYAVIIYDTLNFKKVIQ